MKPSIERIVNEYTRLRKEAFRLKRYVEDVPELRNAFRAFLENDRESQPQNSPGGHLKSDLVVATIMDEFSSDNWSPEFCNIMLSFDDWEREIELFEPDLLFVESAWKGNHSEWAYALEAPRRHSSAKELDRLVAYCAARGIPAIFWNKEDPLHFEKFVDAARLFDLVFTTDADAVPRYQEALGHERVFVLPFAAQPSLCNPVQQHTKRDNRPFFAGSYYASEHGSRTEQMDMLFDALLQEGGVIYDRSYYSDSPDVQMPAKYQRICVPPVPFDQIVNTYKRHSCALNVNSITQSPTMMSRRVFEVLACGRPVVSTPSMAISNLLSHVVDCVTSTEEASTVIAGYTKDADLAARRGHLGHREVLLNHTYNHRLADIAAALDGSFGGVSFLERVKSQTERAKGTLVIISQDPLKAKQILSQLAQQTEQNFDVMLIPSARFDPVSFGMSAQDAIDVKIIRPRNGHTMDDLLAQGLSQVQGEYAVLIDENGTYGRHFLADLILPLRYTEADIIGKAAYFGYCPKVDQTWLLNGDNSHRYVQRLTNGPVLLSKRAIQHMDNPINLKKLHNDLSAKAAKFGLRLYSSDPYNVLITLSQLPSEGRLLGTGRRHDLALI